MLRSYWWSCRQIYQHTLTHIAESLYVSHIIHKSPISSQLSRFLFKEGIRLLLRVYWYTTLMIGMRSQPPFRPVPTTGSGPISTNSTGTQTISTIRREICSEIYYGREQQTEGVETWLSGLRLSSSSCIFLRTVIGEQWGGFSQKHRASKLGAGLSFPSRPSWSNRASESGFYAMISSWRRGARLM